MKMEEDVKRFLEGLNALTRETGIVISGCGCCGSPSLYREQEISDKGGYICERGEEKLTWIEPTSYEWEEHKHKLLR